MLTPLPDPDSFDASSLNYNANEDEKKIKTGSCVKILDSMNILQEKSIRTVIDVI
jgi:hypothetical protein